MASVVGSTSRRAAFATLAAIGLFVTLAAFARSASATTAPGGNITLQVRVSDSGILLIPRPGSHRFVTADGRSAQFPRGIRINFVFTNEGTKTYVPAIRFTDYSNANPYAPKQTLALANAVKPGRHVGLFGNFYFRGAFVLENLFHKKRVGKIVQITIY
jgi:hypothetical protein